MNSMETRITLSALQALDPSGNAWFGDDTPRALAGRCLLDAIEYLRHLPKFRARFREVATAHAIRLVCTCLSDRRLDRGDALIRLQPAIADAFGGLRMTREKAAPHYGDDFWDWAIILQAFRKYQQHFPTSSFTEKDLTNELADFYDAATSAVQKGLMTSSGKGEWYGPATAVAAFSLMSEHHAASTKDGKKLLERLRAQALELVVKGSYRGRPVPSPQMLWHYGQVVARFPGTESTAQAAKLKDIACLKTSEKAEKVYALTRVLQGAQALGPRGQPLVQQCLQSIYDCQDPSRPFGEGLLGENIKGSLNALEVIWPLLSSDDIAQLQPMIDGLVRLQVAANTVGIVVAVEREERATLAAFADAKATIQEKDGAWMIEHPNYHVVVRRGKSLVDVADATRTLLTAHGARWLFMSGIAGSLGTMRRTTRGSVKFKGPDLGHVVIGTSLAPFRIRAKQRKKIENADVPLRGGIWKSIPLDPGLFAAARKASLELFAEKPEKCHEGLIVSCPGIADHPKYKKAVLEEWRGGLAIEEEGYLVGLMGLIYGVPTMVLRGISDRAEGDKVKQKKNPEKEEKKQMQASRAAAELLVRTVQVLSSTW